MNEGLAGKRYPEVRVEVDPAQVRAFAHVLGEREGFVPPTFATVPELAGLAQVIADPELALDFSRVVHVEQSYEWRRPLRAGDILRCRPRIEAVRTRGDTGFLTIVSEIVDAEGEVVVVGRCMLAELMR
jgi:hypothetical protein